MGLKTLLVMPTKIGTWTRAWELPITPFPSLGIRVDVYEVFNVDSVVVGDVGYEVTCIGHLEGSRDVTEKRCEALGFEIAPYP